MSLPSAAASKPLRIGLWAAHVLRGGIGVLLPSLTRVSPRPAVLAALGCTVLQLLAIAFHLSRGEASVVPPNLVLLALAVSVRWGRGSKAPIASR